MDAVTDAGLQRLIDLLGKERSFELLAEEYRACANTELEITNLRWTIYTAFRAVSLALSGYLWASAAQGPTLTKVGLAFRAFVHLVAYCFHRWLHRAAILYREYLREIEQQLGFARYSLRLDRPKIGPVTLRFHWGILLLLLAHISGTIAYIMIA